MLASPLTSAGSSVDVPPGPGLGIEVDEDAVRGHELADYHLGLDLDLDLDGTR